MRPDPHHCDACGAYLANDTDISRHEAWHAALTQTLAQISRVAEHADSWHRPIG